MGKSERVITEALENQGIFDNFLAVNKELYTGLKARIKSEKMRNYFQIRKGIKQGDPMSLTLFNCGLEEVFIETWTG